MNDEERSARRAHAAAEWAAFRDRLGSVTPQGVGRVIVTAIAIAGGVWLAAASWPALVPFVVGGLIAYQLLPVVDALDRIMPRILASLISVLATVAVIVGIAVVVLPPLAGTFVRLAGDLPAPADVDAAIANLKNELGGLPEGAEGVIVPVLTTLVATARDTFAGAAGGLDDIVRAGLAALLNAVGALLGLIVLPTWMLSVMAEKHRARMAIDARITPGLRPDTWAIAAIIDRAAGSYLRGYVVTGFLVGILAYVGLIATIRLGGPQFSEPLALATFAGATQVIPIVGPLLGFLPALLLLPIDPNRALVYLIVYLGARFIGSSMLGSRLMGRRLGVHPAILVPGVVMIGQFGVLWLLLSAPIVAIVVDVIRYVHGRLSEPPRPAGVLPRSQAPADAAASLAPRPVPSSYRPATAPPPIVLAPPQSATPTS